MPPLHEQAYRAALGIERHLDGIGAGELEGVRLVHVVTVVPER